MSLKQVQRRVDALNHRAEQAAERFNTARVELTETTRRLQSARNRYNVTARRVEGMQTLVGRIAVASYKSGSVDGSVALLLSDSPTIFLRQAADLAQVNRRQDAVLADMTAVRLAAAVDRRAVAEERARAADLQETIAVERRTVEGLLADAQSELSRLQADQLARLQELRRAALRKALAARDDAPRASRSGRSGEREASSVSDASAAETAAADTPDPEPKAADPEPKPETPAGDGAGDGAASGRAAAAVRAAYAQLGDPYVWGADGPSSFDCSGLTMYSWAAAGVSLPHSSAAQYSAVRRIPVSDLVPGDLVFYYSPISHVAIYIGDGKIIDAPYPGLSVHIVGLHSMPLVGAGRP